jgi:hypothetical protein
MAEFPYTQVTGKLKSFFEKIQQVGKPDSVDKKWLASIGFRASNDPTIIPILKFIGFVDQAGKPTDRWLAYRDKSRARKVLAEGVCEGYIELFQTYPDAYQRGDNELKSFFSTRSTAGAQAISKTVTTFRTLCELADFSDVTVSAQIPQATAPSGGVEVEHGIPRTVVQRLGGSITININIQLTLPETTDENVYNKLFAALKTHLLSGQQL